MAWSAPKTFTVGEIVTAATMNQEVRDNIRYLKGLDGTVQFSAGIESVGVAGYVKVGVLSTANRDALTAAVGMLVYNSDDDRLEKYQAGTWGVV